MATLLVKSVAGLMQPDISALRAGLLRFVGWQHDATLGAAGGWVLKEEPVSVEYHHDYAKAVQAGSLVACDEATALLCGVAWTPEQSASEQL
jgi:hypothetical protein